MSEQNDRSKQLEDARTLARITTAWREAEEVFSALQARFEQCERDKDYWYSASCKNESRIRVLEARIKELESPLAELARGLADNTNNTKDST